MNQLISEDEDVKQMTPEEEESYLADAEEQQKLEQEERAKADKTASRPEAA